MTIPPPTRRSTPLRVNRKLRQRRSLRALVPSLRAVAVRIFAVAWRAAPWALALMALAAISLGAWAGQQWVTHTRRFALSEMLVTGNTHVTRDAVIRLARVAAGTNVFSVSLAAIEQAVAANPWVERVHAARRLPDRIAIDIVERKAAALVLLGGPYLADDDGEVFRRARSDIGEADGLVVVTGIERELWLREPTLGRAIVREAVRVAALWGEVGGRPRVGEVHVAHTGMTLRALEGGLAVEVGKGTPDELAARFARFDTVWAALSPDERASLLTIHLDNPSRPDRVAVRLADGR